MLRTRQDYGIGSTFRHDRQGKTLGGILILSPAFNSSNITLCYGARLY